MIFSSVTCASEGTAKNAENEAANAKAATRYSHDFKYIDTSRGDNLHLSSGAALKIILNRNFVLNIEYARALSAQDGAGVMYFNTGFYF